MVLIKSSQKKVEKYRRGQQICMEGYMRLYGRTEGIFRRLLSGLRPVRFCASLPEEEIGTVNAPPVVT